jgi:hypothetical protein
MRMGCLLLGTVAFAVGILEAGSSAMAGSCYVDDPTRQQARQSPIQTGAGEELPTLCGHTVDGSGSGGCTLEVSAGDTISSGTCLNLVGAVTVKMNGNTIDCSGSCTDAIRAGGGSFDISDGNITGCWSTGIDLWAATTTSTLTNFLVDLAPTAAGCSGNGNTGIGGTYGFKTLTRVVVADADGLGIGASYLTDIVDSIVHDCGTGISAWATSSSVGTDISGSLIIDNGVNIENRVGTYAGNALTDSTVRNASTCHFKDSSGTCVGYSSILSLHGTNFIDDAIYH